MSERYEKPFFRVISFFILLRRRSHEIPPFSLRGADGAVRMMGLRGYQRHEGDTSFWWADLIHRQNDEEECAIFRAGPLKSPY